MRDTLSKSEASVLLEVAKYRVTPSSSVIARGVFGKETESPYERGKTLRFLERLERRGYLERAGNGKWKGGRLTALGKQRVLFETAFPIDDRPKRQRVKSYPREAMDEGRTAHPKTVVVPGAGVLKPGRNNAKLGAVVTKGALRGYEIYSLTLEERASCPRTCQRWHDCFGNNMPFTRRYKHGYELEKAIEYDLSILVAKIRRGNSPTRGILIRLHVLGDFYSVAYVNFWRCMLLKYPEVSVFGYTAHECHAPSLASDVGRALAHENWFWRHATRKPRWLIRFSGAPPLKEDSAVWHAHGQRPAYGSFACPEQTGKVASCAACAACWQGHKAVSFELH